MNSPLIAAIKVCNHYCLPDHEIDLHGHRHLIITGPNASGKTSLLKLIAAELSNPNADEWEERRRRWEEFKTSPPQMGEITANLQGILEQPHCEIDWSRTPDPSSFVSTLIPDFRSSVFVEPTGPKKMALGNRKFGTLFGSEFLQYLVNTFTTLHMTRDADEAAPIQQELDTLQKAFQDLFAAPDLALVYDKKTFVLEIQVGGEPLVWTHLSAGHQSLLVLIADLHVRASVATSGSPFTAEGVVLIDEPGAHLHPELHERLLPALLALYPNLQFVLATHSAPIISSAPDVWVHDLRNQEGTSSNGLIARPYGSLLRSHFLVPTDYDIATTRRVGRALKSKATAQSREEKLSLRDELASLLVTGDVRVLSAWTDLKLELG